MEHITDEKTKFDQQRRRMHNDSLLYKLHILFFSIQGSAKVLPLACQPILHEGVKLRKNSSGHCLHGLNPTPAQT